jgi:hypothetical protein
MLPALTPDDRPTKAAEGVAAGLVKDNGKGGTPPSFDGLDQELAMTTSTGQPDPDTLVKGLLENPEYKARLLVRYTKTGVGYATGEDGIPHRCLILAVAAGR